MYVVATSWRRTLIGEDPDKWLYLGVDADGTSLEIVTIQGDDEVEVVIHAMKMRKKYLRRGGR